MILVILATLFLAFVGFAAGYVVGDLLRDTFGHAIDRAVRTDAWCAHASDCAVHNGPALPAGPCNCGGLSHPMWQGNGA